MKNIRSSASAGQARSGETLIEVLMAVSVLMIVIVPAAGLKVQSIRDMALNRDQLKAVTLAEEGVEILRNMRDTNFLKFSAKAKECWNTKPDYTDIDTCEKPNNKIESGSYILKRNVNTLNWSLKNLGSNMLSDDVEFTADSEYLLKLDPSTDLYNHDIGSDTGFFREIYIEYDGDKRMNILSRVFFISGIKTKIIKLSYYLTDQQI